MSAAAPSDIRQLDFEAVRRILPHRFPLILVDRVTELEPGSRIVAVKNVTANELHFLGHFPDQAVMPGVLIIEAAAQAVAIMCRTGTSEEARGYLAHTTMSFRQVVTPGDQMLIEASVYRRVGKLLIAKVKVRVAGAVVADGELTVAQKE
jgi:3-hydroxyacyl-[acyl-carrier-protein] dehydratase